MIYLSVIVLKCLLFHVCKARSNNIFTKFYDVWFERKHSHVGMKWKDILGSRDGFGEGVVRSISHCDKPTYQMKCLECNTSSSAVQFKFWRKCAPTQNFHNNKACFLSFTQTYESWNCTFMLDVVYLLFLYFCDKSCTSPLGDEALPDEWCSFRRYPDVRCNGRLV